MKERDELIETARAFWQSESTRIGPFWDIAEIMVDFLIEQSQSHGFLELQMVFLAEAMERDCEEKIKAAVAAERSRALTAIADEPELPDAIPDEMVLALRVAALGEDKATLQEVCRVIVRLTKDGIRKRLEGDNDERKGSWSIRDEFIYHINKTLGSPLIEAVEATGGQDGK